MPSETPASYPSIPVLYVAGVGRSGSTVLDTILGNHPEVESVGELAKLVTAGWTAGEYCACGETGRTCPFWTAVERRWLAGDEREARFAEYVDLQRTFERWRSWPRLVAEGRRPSPAFQRYGELTRNLLAAVQAESGRRVIADSSKVPARAFALSLVPGVELAVVHLVRDPRGTAWSYQKTFRKNERQGVQHDLAPLPVWRSAVGWLLANSLVERLRRQVPRLVSITYEGLVSAPRRALAEVAAVSGLDFDPLAERLERGESLAVRHTIAGNQLRMRGSVALRADLEWSRRMPRRQQRLVALLAGPLMARYGYPLAPRTATGEGRG